MGTVTRFAIGILGTMALYMAFFVTDILMERLGGVDIDKFPIALRVPIIIAVVVAITGWFHFWIRPSPPRNNS